MTNRNKYLLLAIAALLQLTLWFNTGCANRGVGPQGGPVDTIPPVITKMTVQNGQRNVTTKEMYIQFNEFIQIDGSTENILISPPQQRPPEIKAVGKKLEINFQEDLQDSTTYTIDFGDQIVDNNEKNPYKDLSLCFTTGDQLDSLEIYGQLINAADLNPISGVVIGIHADMEDSAFYKKPFTRIARTNEQGEFVIRNIKSGTYRLYALQDQSRDYCFQPGEALAFCDTTITPYITYDVELDTIFLPDTLSADSLPVADSVVIREYFYYEPSNLILRLFSEDYQRLYFQRAIRNEAHLIQLNFNGPQPQIPQFTAMRLDNDSLAHDSLWVDFTEHSMIQMSDNMDTFKIWLSDSAAIRMDSIQFSMTYYITDSAYNIIPQTDTILSVFRAPVINERTRKTIEEKRLKTGLILKCNANSKFNYFDTLFLTSPTPIESFEADSIHLIHKEDTTLTPVPFQIEKKDSIGLKLAIIASLSPEQDYQLLLDSGAIRDIYQLSNNKDKFDAHVRSVEEYATITIFIQPYSDSAYIQLLNDKDLPIKIQKADSSGTKFSNMEAGTYYLRIFLDENGDGQWTTGDFTTHRQPEQVYYFQKKLNLRANWEFEQHFDWQLIPLLDQKPTDIRKDAAAKK